MSQNLSQIVPMDYRKDMQDNRGAQSPHFGPLAHTRHQEKVAMVLSWLTDWRYSTMRILMLRLGLDPTTNRSFQKRFRETKLIREIPQGVIREKVWMLTPTGRDQSPNLRAPYYNTDVSKISETLIRHNLTVQTAVVRQAHKFQQWTPDHQLAVDTAIEGQAYIAPAKLADVVLKTSDGLKHALEIELSYKKTAGIYWGFIEHMRAIEDGHLGMVTYLFQDQAMRGHYARLFGASHWPAYTRNKNGLTRVHRHGQPYQVAILRYRDRFQFGMVEDSLRTSLG